MLSNINFGEQFLRVEKGDPKMQHFNQNTSLYGSLVSHHHFDGAQEYRSCVTQQSLSDLSRLTRTSLVKVSTSVLHRLSTHRLHAHLLIAIEIAMMTFPFAGNATDIGMISQVSSATQADTRSRNLNVMPTQQNMGMADQMEPTCRNLKIGRKFHYSCDVRSAGEFRKLATNSRDRAGGTAKNCSLEQNSSCTEFK